MENERPARRLVALHEIDAVINQSSVDLRPHFFGVGFHHFQRLAPFCLDDLTICGPLSSGMSSWPRLKPDEACPGRSIFRGRP